MASNEDFYNAVADSIERMQKRIDELEGKDNIREAKNVLNDLKRERSLGRAEKESYANESALLATKMNDLSVQLKEAQEKTIAEIEKKEKSARASQLLIQSKITDIELQISGLEVDLSDKSLSLAKMQQEIDRSFANAAILKDRIHHDEGSIRKAAYEAAEYSVKALNDQKMSEEIQRQMRILYPSAFTALEQQEEAG